jgi:hemoglobin-like flavoprotein
MTENQIVLVQTTWKKLSQNADGVALLFYDRLFTVRPDIKTLFRGDMMEQQKQLVQMISAAVEGLNDFEKLTLVVQDLGRRHRGYGVQHEHYRAVGEALLWSLESSLGDAFDEETSLAWSIFYEHLTDTMQTQTS